MQRYIIITILSSFFLFTGLTVMAQDDGGSEFDDYSYLWEDKKKKKKKKKRDEPVQEATLADPEPVIAQDTTVLDSTRTQEVAPDSVDQLLNRFNILQDTTVLDSVETVPDEIEPDDLVEEEKEEKEKKDKSGKKDYAPIDDFRSGLPSGESKGSFDGGFTFTQIGGQNYVGMILSPEFSIWKIGLGLNVPILYGLETKKIRTEIFKGGIGVGRLIRYIRFGNQKRDQIYVRVGELDGTMIGFGSLVNNYTNTTSYEKRKMGIHYDFHYRGLFGLEGMYSDFNTSTINLLAIRPYVRPLAWSGIPIINTFEVGFQMVRDRDQTKTPTSDSTNFVYTFTEPGIGGIGFDMGVTVLSIPFLQTTLFGGWTKLNVASPVLTDSLTSIFNATSEPAAMSDGFANGSGWSYGINLRFNFIANILSTDVRIERLGYREHYLPMFFDAIYELNKDQKLLSTGSAVPMSGIYGSLQGQIVNKVKLGGSLMIPDEITEASPALLRLNVDLERLADKVSLHGSYVKGNLSDLKDAFVFDENSLAKVRFIWHLNKFIAAGVDYYWAFVVNEDGSYTANQYFSPYFGVSIAF